MSSLIVEVCRVDKVEPHPNADRMKVAHVKGWRVCVACDPATGQAWCREGDRAVYFPPDTVLPPEVSDKHGVTKYLGALPKREDGTRPPGGRVMVASLRGFKSYGFLAPPDDPAWEVGRDVKDHYGATKFEPPVRSTAGDAEAPHPAFHRYYAMEHLRNFPTAIADGEEVVVTEKLHGENCRLGLVRDTEPDGRAVWRWMAGSHDVRRKRWSAKRQPDGTPGEPVESAYWRCFSPGVRACLCAVTGCGYTPEEIDAVPTVGADGWGPGRDAVLFGERFGSGVQDLWYGHTGGHFSFRAFDLMVGGEYLDHDSKVAFFKHYDVPAVPVLYRGPYDFEKVVALAEGPTLAAAGGEPTGFREGVVVVTARERPFATEAAVRSRAQFKIISFAYLARKDGTEYH